MVGQVYPIRIGAVSQPCTGTGRAVCAGYMVGCHYDITVMWLCSAVAMPNHGITETLFVLYVLVTTNTLYRLGT